MIKTIIDKLSKSNYIIIKPEDLIQLINQAKIIKVENTYFYDYIRILEIDEIYIIQETTNKNEIILRKMNSLYDAENFLQDRLKFYERKWDGCGCKIFYYE
jgi:hypothetical protein